MLDVQYALSSHEFLVKFVEIVSSGLIHQGSPTFNYTEFFLSLNDLTLSNIIIILKMLMGKIYQTTFDDIIPSGNTANKNFQKILVESGITLLLI